MMNRKTPLIALAVLLPALWLNSCAKKDNSTAKQELAINDSVAVKISEAKNGNIEISKNYIANVEGQKQTGVFAKTSEKVAEVKVRVGDRVKEGQLLFVLDKSGPTSQYRQLEFSLANSAKDLDRLKNLLKEGAVSQQNVDAAQTQYNVTKTNLDAARSALEITAPISGVITALSADIGDQAIPSSALATVADVSRLIVKFSVGETEISRFQTGKQIMIVSDNDSSLKVPAQVTKVTGLADVKTRSFDIEAAFANQNGMILMPGMFCKVAVQLSGKKDILTIPNEAIISEENNRVVFVAENGHAKKKVITTGLTNGALTEVLTGISAGEQVITTGIGSIKDGSLVVIVK